MRTFISLAVGFWLGRQVYINYDREEAILKEKAARKRIKKLLEENGLSKDEAKANAAKIIPPETE